MPTELDVLTDIAELQQVQIDKLQDLYQIALDQANDIKIMLFSISFLVIITVAIYFWKEFTIK